MLTTCISCGELFQFLITRSNLFHQRTPIKSNLAYPCVLGFNSSCPNRFREHRFADGAGWNEALVSLGLSPPCSALHPKTSGPQECCAIHLYTHTHTLINEELGQLGKSRGSDSVDPFQGQGLIAWPRSPNFKEGVT